MLLSQKIFKTSVKRATCKTIIPTTTAACTTYHFNYFSTGNNNKKLSPNKIYVKERADKNKKLDELAGISQFKWKIQAGMLCSRPPVITPDVEEWEERYFHLLDKRERATFSDYEQGLYPRMKGDIEYYYDGELGEEDDAEDDDEQVTAHESDASTEKEDPDVGDVVEEDGAENDMDDIDIDDLLDSDIDFLEYDVQDEEMEEDIVEEEELDDGFGPRVTEADIANDRTTVNRRLQEYVYLLVKKKDPETGQEKWFFPRTLKPEENGNNNNNYNNNNNDDDDESDDNNNRPLKDFAIDSIGHDIGKQVQDELYVYGNGPSAYYIEEYEESKKTESGYFGVKTFFYKSQVWGQTDDPPMELNSDVIEHAWVARDEIEEYLNVDDEEFGKYMLKVLW